MTCTECRGTGADADDRPCRLCPGTGAWPWTATSAQRGGEGNDDATAAPAQPAAGTRGLQAAIGSVARPSLFLVAWRWRYELALAAGLAIAVIGLVRIPAAAWVAAGSAAEFVVAADPATGPAAVVAVAALWPDSSRPCGFSLHALTRNRTAESAQYIDSAHQNLQS